MTPHADLIAAARAAAGRAYAPYSQFRVGAAVRTPGGAVFAAGNVENASYGLTCCAERNAVFQMVAAGEIRFDTVAIYTPTPTPTAPCGACRQVLYEFNPAGVVVAACDGPAVTVTTVSELLPGAFGPTSLAPSTKPV